jgi:dTMP kinase
MINSYLSGATESEDHVIHLLFSANRWEAAYVPISPAYLDFSFMNPIVTKSSALIQADLAAGTTIIIDRYYYSGCVYSAAKHNPNMPLEWCRKPDIGLPRPDLCVFLDISADDAAKRGGYGTEKYEKKEMQDRVRELFETLMQSKEGEDFVKVDAGSSLEDVQRRVREEVDRCIEHVDTESLPLRVVEEW